MRQVLIIVSFILIIVANIAIASNREENAKAIDISGGESHTLVLTANKRTWACGPNGGAGYYGVLGTGSTNANLVAKTLVQVHDGDMNTPSTYLEDINDVDAGLYHSLALESYDPCDPNYMGYVWAWGGNLWGQLGDGSNFDRSTPVQVLRGEQTPADPNDPNLARVVDISAGRSGQHSLAVDANGYVYAWGDNMAGQCGNGESGNSKLTAVQVLAGAQNSGDPNSPLQRIIAVSAGSDHSMALEAYDPCDPNWGRVYTWGDDVCDFEEGQNGILGTGGVVEGMAVRPVCVWAGEQDYNEPNQVYLKHIVAISAGWDHSMALEKYDQPDPLEKWLDPNGNGGADPNHKGQVYTWGNNSTGRDSDGGRLGDGSTTTSTTPVLVLRGEQEPEDPCNPDPNLTRIIAVSAGEGHSMALDVEGNVYCWGDNDYGQLGDGSEVDSLTPVRVLGEDGEGYLENIVAISAGYWHSLAIDANGTIWTWGKGAAGRLGLADKTVDCNIPHPIQVVYNLTQKTFAFAIQTAIHHANEEDVLEASSGTYFENVVLGDESITLKSVDPENRIIVDNTIVDSRYNSGAGPTGIYPAVDFNDSSASTLAGLTLVKATAGGVLCENVDSATILNCSIHNNEWHGIRLTASSADIQNCDIRANISVGTYDTHGIYCVSASDVNITNCVVAENDASGIVCQASSLAVKNSLIEDNADHGIYESNPASASVIKNSMIRGNGADGVRSEGFSSGPQIANNWIYSNGSTGIVAYNDNTVPPPDSNAVIVNNTIVNNDAGGVMAFYGEDAEIRNSIVWDNGSSPSANLSANNGTFGVDYSCIEETSGYNGTDNINSDPCFVDTDANDFHLDTDSPCIDTDDPSFEADANETDIDGGPRVINDRVDMGGDEFWPSDFSRDGIVNFIDYAMLASKWHTDANDPNYDDDFDIEDNNSIDFNDVMVLCEDWLFNAELWPVYMPLMGGPGMEGMWQMDSIQAVSYETAITEESPPITEPVDFEYLLDWLAEIWLDPEVQDSIDAEAWLRMYQSLEEELNRQ
jgi:alpha-tubulin suppressor-like RCC1 family protein